MADQMFVHSGCCQAHWELVYDTKAGTWSLACESCGKGPGPRIAVTGPKLEDCQCAECGKQAGVAA
jgi:hypothetical protein